MTPSSFAGSTSRTVSPALAAAGVVGFAALMALAAQMKITLPGTGVPLTFQSFAVLLAPMVLGAGLGAASVALYLLIGLLGLPVFALGHAGPGYVFGQTGGFLLGFLLAAPLSASIAGTRWNWWRCAAGIGAGHAVIFALGVPVYGLVNHLSPEAAFGQALAPFVLWTFVQWAMTLAGSRPFFRAIG